jgi:CRISPR-associated endonuclease/helicase Cas3
MSCLCDHLFSHPGKLLEDHLRNVGQTVRNWINNLQLNFDVNKDALSDIACIIGLAHDLGKSTRSFQRYLLTEDEELKKKLKNHKETRHSPLGAFCGYYLIQEYIKLNHLETEHADFLPMAGFLAIQRHHGDLNTFVAETPKYKASDINGYLQDVDRVSFEKLLVAILNLVPGLVHCNYSWLEEKINSYDKDMRKIRSSARTMGRRQDPFNYFIIGLFYSTLIDADKSDASGLNKEYTNYIISGNLVDKYKRILGYDKPGTEINRLRNKIYQGATNVSEAIEKGKHILSINVPTGTGKTLNALSAALKIRELLYSRKAINRSIIYALPFTSIIDQNYQVFNEVFNKTTGREPGNDVLLKHHYLADAFYKLTENDDEYLEYSPLESQFIIEGWNSSIIVTTFVQLFHSLITNRNTAFRKFHRMANSIIILDEVQAIPHQYWQLMRQICNYMALYMDTYFIFVTATLPLIFPENEIYELVANKQYYYKVLNRIKLDTYIDQIISINDFKEIVIQETLSNKEKDILVVMNTIRSAQIIYEELINNLDEKDNTFIYLSSHFLQ